MVATMIAFKTAHILFPVQLYSNCESMNLSNHVIADATKTWKLSKNERFDIHFNFHHLPRM